MARFHARSERPKAKFPPELRWGNREGCRPLPQIVFAPAPRQVPGNCSFALDPVFRNYPGKRGEPFDFSGHMHRLITDIAHRCPFFSHLDPQRVLVGCSRTRNGSTEGLMARIAGLRNRGGELIRVHRRRRYVVQRFWLNDVEILYVLLFYLPRFQDQTFEEKMTTVFHELYHISPDFDGDLRRCPKTDRFHVGGKKGYDALMIGLARDYLQSRPDPDLYAFLRLNFAQLHQWHGEVFGHSVPLPKLVQMTE